MESARLRTAREAGYLVTKGGTLHNPEWWGYCSKLKLPYVVVVPRREYATVRVDMLPTGRDLSEGEYKEVVGMLIDSGAYDTVIGPESLASGDIPIEQAGDLAAALVRILHKP